MLRIVDYAKRSNMEWYEVVRISINEETINGPIAILTHGELRVFELDDDELIGNFPGQEPIQLAYEECEMNPAFLSRLIHARFPVVFKPVNKNKSGVAGDFYQLDNIPLKPPTLIKFKDMDKVWFGFNNEIHISLDEIWMPSNSILSKPIEQKREIQNKHKKHIKPHSFFIAFQIENGKRMFSSWQHLKKLSAESRGSEKVDLPGYGPIYLKQDSKDIKKSILYSENPFRSSTDGKIVRKGSFDRAWNRIVRQN